MTYSKKIILGLIVFSFICLSYLAYIEKMQQDYNFGKSWWTTYFADPKSQDLSFVIENHSSENSFHWEASIDKSPILSGDVEVNIGEKKSIPVPFFSDSVGKKVDVKISTQKGFKEIYKNF